MLTYFRGFFQGILVLELLVNIYVTVRYLFKWVEGTVPFHAFSDVLALTVFYVAALVLPLLASSVVKEVKTQEGDKAHLKKMETSKWVAIFSAVAMIALVVVTQNAQIKLFILITVVGSFYLNIAALYDWANYRPYIEKRLATYFPSRK